MGLFSSLFRSRKSPETPQIPAPPPVPELMDIIDDISGTQTITVVGADGKKRRHTQRLPLTKEEQEILSQAESLITQAVKNIETLYQYDPDTVVSYQPFIQAFSDINDERIKDLSQIGNFQDIASKVQQFRDINRNLALRDFDKSQRMTEENLARRGISRSTDAAEYRAAMAGERALLEQKLDVESQNYGEDLANKQLTREGNLYNIREAGRAGRLQAAEAEYNLGRQTQADLEALRKGAIEENMNFLNVGQGIKSADVQKAQLALAGNQNAISLLGTQAAAQNARYNSDVNRLKTQYKIDLEKFKNTPATFGQQIRDIGMASAGSYLGGVASGAMGGSPSSAGYEFGSKIRG